MNGNRGRQPRRSTQFNRTACAIQRDGERGIHLLSADLVLFVKFVPCGKQPRNVLGIFDIILEKEEMGK